MSRQQIYLAIIALGLCYGLVRLGLSLRGEENSDSPAATGAPLAPATARAEMANTATAPLERAKAIDTVATQRDTDSMPELIRLLDDADPLVRARAGVAITQILQADFFFRADDPPNIRREAIHRIRNHWEAWKAKGLPGAK